MGSERQSVQAFMQRPNARGRKKPASVPHACGNAADGRHFSASGLWPRKSLPSEYAKGDLFNMCDLEL